MKIIIGNDHGGYALKLKIIEELNKRPDIVIEDVGSHSEESVRYPIYAALVAKAVSGSAAAASAFSDSSNAALVAKAVSGPAAAASAEPCRGILICSTGIGMSLAANKYRGVRATLCTSTFMGKMSRAHNDSNVLCLGGRVTGYLEALDILNAWLDTAFDGGRHAASLELVRECEAND